MPSPPALVLISLSMVTTTLAAIGNRIPEMCATTAGEACIFPFTYRGVEHLDCTYADSTTAWCATMVDFSGKVVTNRSVIHLTFSK